jgi:hypothetical protein
VCYTFRRALDLSETATGGSQGGDSASRSTGLQLLMDGSNAASPLRIPVMGLFVIYRNAGEFPFPSREDVRLCATEFKIATLAL